MTSHTGACQHLRSGEDVPAEQDRQEMLVFGDRKVHEEGGRQTASQVEALLAQRKRDR